MKKQLALICALLAMSPVDAYSRRRKKLDTKPHLFKELAQLAQAEMTSEITEDIQEPAIFELESTEESTSDEKQELAKELETVPAQDKDEPEEISEPIDTQEQNKNDILQEEPKQELSTEKSLIAESLQEKSKPGDPLKSSPDLEFDVQKKKKDVVKLVEHAAQALRDKPFDEVCNLFSHTKEFILGELYIFVYDMKGNCLAHGENSELIWQNLIDLKDWVGTPIVKDILSAAKQGGGWTTYGWNNSTKISYIVRVQKDNTTYAIGCGFYPQSKSEAVVNLVKGGVALFNQMKNSGDPIDWAFSRLSYPRGAFVSGNLYLYALDFEGTIVAQGERPGLINTNSWNYRDEKGKYVNREIVSKLKTATNGIWIEYISKRTLKKAYAERVTAPDGRDYFIACGYYPFATRDPVEELVRKGYQFMKSHGKSAAIEEFSSRRSNTYRYGDLSLTVYDMQGKVIADGGNADQIGINMMEAKDEDGHLYIKEIINRATKTGSWSNAKVKSAFQSTYAAKIDLGLESFVIASSYYPVSKSENMTLLVQSAASFLKDNPREEAFAQFVKGNGSFRRGDLQIFILNTDGLCFAYGDDYDLIWRNLLKLQDDDGRPFIKMFINSAQQGPNYVKIKLNKANKIVYVMPVEKDGKKYIIGSGYYQ